MKITEKRKNSKQPLTNKRWAWSHSRRSLVKRTLGANVHEEYATFFLFVLTAKTLSSSRQQKLKIQRTCFSELWYLRPQPWEVYSPGRVHNGHPRPEPQWPSHQTQAIANLGPAQKNKKSLFTALHLPATLTCGSRPLPPSARHP